MIGDTETSAADMGREAAFGIASSTLAPGPTKVCSAMLLAS